MLSKLRKQKNMTATTNHIHNKKGCRQTQNSLYEKLSHEN